MATLASTHPVVTRHRTTETAKHFKVSEMTLYRWRHSDGFPKPVKRGRIVLYDIAAIDKWLIGREA